MKYPFLILIINLFIVISCVKNDTPEEIIKFTVTPDNSAGIISITSDTFNLSIMVTSKIPDKGVIYSIMANWTDSLRTIYKLDSISSLSKLSLRMLGFKKEGNYTIKVIVTANSNPLNTASISIDVINNLVDRFKGYNVDPMARTLGQAYWENCGVLPDLIVDIFQRGTQPLLNGIYTFASFSTDLVCGDFNLDGYIDVFNAGAACNGLSANLAFLIWNPITKKFDEKNLLNDNSTTYIGGPTKVIPVYLNNDDYVDLVILGHRDECNPSSLNEPTLICLSDGQGGYDLNKLTLEPKFLADMFTHEGGDIGDLNGDGLPDLFIASNSHTYIFWGVSGFPYFTNLGYAHFASDTVNFQSDNGFGEIVPDGGGSIFTAHIADVNGDGNQDILLGCGEDRNSNVKQRVLINQGGGRFNESGIIKLPNYYQDSRNIVQHDYIVDDLNGDGLNDIIALNTTTYNTWDLCAYIQQRDGIFNIDNSWFQYTISNSRRLNWKSNLIYKDFNGDGKKDISYVDAGCMAWNVPDNDLIFKSVFIRTGNQFLEQDFYQYDVYAKNLKKNYFVSN